MIIKYKNLNYPCYFETYSFPVNLKHKPEF